MPELDFIPHDEPQSDYVIVKNDSDQIEQTLTAIGAIRRASDSYTAYLWNSRLGSDFILGLGVIDGRLLFGPRRLRQVPNILGAGSYTIINLSDDCATVTPDPFGMNPVYSSENFITNRLHLAGLVQRHVDVDASLSCLYNDGGFSFSLNMFKTPIQGVQLAPAGSTVTLNQQGVHVHQFADENTFNRLDPGSYWKLIEMGATEIIANVEAVVDSGFPIYADLTGGRDSRLVFGALVAAGRQNDVIFNTLTNTTTPGLVADLNIATGLVSEFGGQYTERPRAFGYSHYSVDQNLQRRRSQIYGTYHWLVPTDIRPVATLNRTQTIKMLGGGGELYRDYWQPLLFNTVDANSEPTPDDLTLMLQRHTGTHLGTKYLPRYIEAMLDTFSQLPGKNLGDKLDAHYLNFRNRFHFGPRQSQPESMSTINVAMSRSLLHAARSLPAHERATGRVLFDVTQALDERLAYLPYESPSDPNIFNSPYHRTSQYDQTELQLNPAVHLALPKNDNRQHLRPIRPVADDWDYEATLDSEIDFSINILRNPSSRFHFLPTSDLQHYVDWAKTHSLRTRQALASKLRAFADYDAL